MNSRKSSLKIIVDMPALVAYRLAGATHKQCAKRFGVNPGLVKSRLNGLPKPLAPPKQRRAARGTPLNAYEVRLTPEQRAFVKQQGGAVWLRSLIDAQIDTLNKPALFGVQHERV